jgi:CubicO group peptidase (beta-lactamase class C family)
LIVVLYAVWFIAGRSSASNLFRDRGGLEKKIAEIVQPHLHSVPAVKTTEQADQNGKDGAPRGRAWGIVVGVVTKDNRGVFGFGRMSADSDRRPDGKTLFEIGSITKTFTALLLSDLVERGKVTLDDPVRLHLPESVMMPKRGGKEITLFKLATHTSALPRIPSSIRWGSLVWDDPYKGYGAEDLYKSLARTELARDPGEQYEYSNLGFALLGHVVSRQAGVSYEELVIERICRPLQLSDTRIVLNDDHLKRFAPPYAANGTASSNWTFDVFAGAGALRSTADDMLKYVAANMGLEKTELLTALRRCHEARRPTSNKIQSICLSWHDEKMPKGARLVFHGGGTGGHTSLVGFVEEDGQPTLGLVVLCNAGAAGSGMVANDVAVKLLKALRED